MYKTLLQKAERAAIGGWKTYHQSSDKDYPDSVRRYFVVVLLALMETGAALDKQYFWRCLGCLEWPLKAPRENLWFFANLDVDYAVRIHPYRLSGSLFHALSGEIRHGDRKYYPSLTAAFEALFEAYRKLDRDREAAGE